MSSSKTPIPKILGNVSKATIIRDGEPGEVLFVGGFRTRVDPSQTEVSPEQFTVMALGTTKEIADATAHALNLGMTAPECTYTSLNTEIYIDGVTQGSVWNVLVGEGKFHPYPLWDTDMLYISNLPFGQVDDWAEKLWEIRTVESKELYRIFGLPPEETA